jgi:hypothetical protein
VNSPKIDDAEVLKEIKLESELSVGVFRAWILGAPADSGAMFWLCAAVALFAAVTFSACVTTLEAMRIAICPTRPVNHIDAYVAGPAPLVANIHRAF